MAYLKRKILKLDYKIPIQHIKLEDRLKFVLDDIKKYEGRCSKYGFIKKVDRVKKMHSPLINQLDFSCDVFYKAEISCKMYEINEHDVMEVNVIDNNEICVCGVQDTPFLILVVNPNPDLKPGDKIKVQVKKHKYNTKTNQIQIVCLLKEDEE